MPSKYYLNVPWVMFKLVQVINPKTNKEEFRLDFCSDIKQALDIVHSFEKRRCPGCGSSECFGNFLGMLRPGGFFDIFLVEGFELLRCKKGDKFFVAEKLLKLSDAIGKCPWCGSPFTEKLPDKPTISIRVDDEHVIEVEESKLKEELRKWFVSTQRNPYRCKHCKRYFSGSQYVNEELYKRGRKK